jgi:hypothetical protein
LNTFQANQLSPQAATHVPARVHAGTQDCNGSAN